AGAGGSPTMRIRRVVAALGTAVLLLAGCSNGGGGRSPRALPAPIPSTTAPVEAPPADSAAPAATPVPTGPGATVAVPTRSPSPTPQSAAAGTPTTALVPGRSAAPPLTAGPAPAATASAVPTDRGNGG